MKKLVFVMPLMAISLLASCGGSKQIKYYTITFHSNEGSEVPTLYVPDGKVASEPKNPTKDTFIFAGWYTEDKLENYFNFSTKIEKDYDLYARWEGEFEYKVTLEADNKLTLENEGGFFNQSNFTSRILLKDEYRNKYDLPYSKSYYEVTVNDNPIDNFEIEQVIYGSPTEYYVNLTIPKELLGYDIEIKTEPYCHYLTFTGAADDAKIYYMHSFSKESKAIPEIMCCYSLDNPSWEKWEPNDVKTLAKNQTIYVKNTKNTLSTPEDGEVSFKTEAEGSPNMLSGGNVMSLVNFSNLSENCFFHLFRNCKLLKSAPILPATTLASGCYSEMFEDCISLTSAPKLPATTLADYCYYYMFDGCALIDAPKLPATTLTESCYKGMFRECKQLVKAPELPVTELKKECYTDMFGLCLGLVSAPELPATDLKEGCYAGMFLLCSNLHINNNGSGTKFFDCPNTTPENCVLGMFMGTTGTYTADPVPGESYYYTFD